MPAPPKYDHELLRRLKSEGWTWKEIRDAHYPDSCHRNMCSSHNHWIKRRAEDNVGKLREEFNAKSEDQKIKDTSSIVFNPDDAFTREVTGSELAGINSLDDLVAFFGLDVERWTISRFRCRANRWQQNSNKKGLVNLHQYRIDAEFMLRPEVIEDEVEAFWERFKEEAAAHAPRYELVERDDPAGGREVIAVMALFDLHLGMLAWGKEVGNDYDSEIALQGYAQAVADLLATVKTYRNVKKIVFIGGNDFLHVDQFMDGGKGGATTKGTPQDIDSRPFKMFTLARKALVEAVDMCRAIAPVELRMVPGNHDRDNISKLGEVMAAWYRNDPEVQVFHGPRKLQFFNWENVTLMFTHGEEYKRKRDPLPLIMATECPAEMWVASEDGLREVLTGHNHIRMAGRYHPTSEANESRAVRTQSLSGMTPEDGWHYEQGYKHHRAASLRVYHSRGLAGHHEYKL